MQNNQSDPLGTAPLLQSACAFVSGLLLVGVLAYAIILGPGTAVDLAEAVGNAGIALGYQAPH